MRRRLRRWCSMRTARTRSRSWSRWCIRPTGVGGEPEVTIAFTVTDGDGDTATGSLTVNVNDDTPIANTVTAAPVLDDDAQTLFPGNPGGTGDVANATVATGVAGALFSAGADGLQSISFTNPVV